MAKILTLTLNPALDLTVQLPRLEPGQVNRSDEMHTHAAGKGVNVAQVADLGHQLTVSGFLGEDNLQAFETLFANGFCRRFIRVPGETRSNIKLAESDGRITDINGPGPQVSAAAQQLLDVLTGSLRGMTRSSSPAACRGRQPAVVAGVDPALERTRSEGRPRHQRRSLARRLKAGPWLIKPNTEELAEALGCEVVSVTAQAAAANRLHAQGIEHVVISHGADGVNWFSVGSALHATPPKVSVASTVGAGDSLLADAPRLLSADRPSRPCAAPRRLPRWRSRRSVSASATRRNWRSSNRGARASPDRTIRGLVMKLAIVTACPNGMVTSVLCARLLDAAAQRQGWSTSVEVNDAAHPERQLSAATIEAAEWVLLVTSAPVDMSRFVGKRVFRAPRRKPCRTSRRCCAGAKRPLVAPEAVAEPVAVSKNAPRLVAITAARPASPTPSWPPKPCSSGQAPGL
jgi:1-phosphofructokinase